MRLALSLTALLLVATPVATEARWRPDTQQARLWLKAQMPRRQFRCLDTLWSAESGWRVRARGPMTRWGRAYGLPQALPGSKMASAERPKRGELWDDWRTDALVQASWGIHYIRGRYGSACAALRHFRAFRWY